MSDVTPIASAVGSVTLLLEQLQNGDPAAAQALWESYFTRLVALARARLWAAPRGMADEEDVALSAFHSLVVGAAAGRFPRLGNRDDLWQVLFFLTTRKAIGLVRHETCERRGGGRVGSLTEESGSDAPDLAALTPTPALVAEVTDQCGRLLGLLRGGDLRHVAIWKMEGYTNVEIAGKLKRSVATVERKLTTIRAIWERETQR